MENQHRKIKGYRELNENEIALMNRFKELGSATGELLRELESMRIAETPVRGTVENDKRNESFSAMAIAKTELQTGFMWAVRAVALPDSF